MKKEGRFSRILLIIGLLFIIAGFTISPFGLLYLHIKGIEKNKVVEKISVSIEQEDTVEPLILKLQPRLDPIVSKTISNAIVKYSNKFNLPPELIISLINRESRFKILARSSKGAIGLMQIMARAHKDKLKELNITPKEVYHIDNNVHLGCWILRDYYDNTKSIEKALFKYVGGKEQKYVNDILKCLATILIEDSMEGKKDGNKTEKK